MGKAWLVRKKSHTAQAQADICPIMVATAAPTTPMAGMPIQPKIRIGSRIRFTTAPSPCKNMGIIMLPVAWNIFSTQMWKRLPKDRQMTMVEY